MKETTIDPTSFLLLPNSKFRASNNPLDKSFIHDSQIDCAKNVIHELLEKRTRRNSVILSAKMQSGKTGVTTAMVNIITNTPLYREMGVDKFFFITGMNDTGLKEQTSMRIIHQVIKANVDNTYIGKRSKRNLSKNIFYVLKNSDLMKFDETTLNNSIIFIDEAHYGSNERNNLTKFMSKHHLDWKNTNALIGRNTYIVSVSATPFDEIFSDKAECKKIIELKPGANYVGISEMLSQGIMHNASSDDVAEDGFIFEYIKDAHDRMIADGNDGAIIIRTTKFDVITNDEYVKNNFDIFEMYSAGKKLEYDKLNGLMSKIVSRNKINSMSFKNTALTDVPKIEGKPLLVLIKGAYRAGITLDASFKDYIYMIFDCSLKSDTTAQALLGRMCGYRNTTKYVNRTHFYVNLQFAEMYSNWEQNMQDKNALPSNKTTFDWIANDIVSDNTKLKTKSRGNFTVQLDGDECKEFISYSKLKKDKLAKTEKLLKRIFKKNNIDCQYDFIGDLYISGKNTYAKSTQKKRFDSFTEDSLVCQFDPSKLHGFSEKTNRTILTHDDLGKTGIGVMLDCTLDIYNGVVGIGGNRRLLVYSFELGQQALMPNRKDMYKKHKDTTLI